MRFVTSSNHAHLALPIRTYVRAAQWAGAIRRTEFGGRFPDMSEITNANQLRGSEFKRLMDLGYVSIRYDESNALGVRHEPWHVRVT